MDPDGSRAFIACSPSNNVSVFSLKTLEVTGYIAAGNEPGGLAWPGLGSGKIASRILCSGGRRIAMK